MLSIHCIMKYILHFIVLSMSLMRRCQLLLGCWVVLIISKIKINRIPTNKITIITLIAKLWHIHHSYCGPRISAHAFPTRMASSIFI